jgi:hypothetical protein
MITHKADMAVAKLLGMLCATDMALIFFVRVSNLRT